MAIHEVTKARAEVHLAWVVFRVRLPNSDRGGIMVPTQESEEEFWEAVNDEFTTELCEGPDITGEYSIAVEYPADLHGQLELDDILRRLRVLAEQCFKFDDDPAGAAHAAC